MGNITLEQIMSVCGNYTIKNGYNYNFPCPCCRQEGHDSKGDNLVYNSTKGIIKCFFDDSHTLQVLDLINKNSEHKNYKVTNKTKEIPIWERNQDKYIEYLGLAQNVLLNRPDLLDFIYNKRGLRKETLDLCGVGFDDTENCFVIPIISLKVNKIVDFELREYSKVKKIRRVGGGSATIAKIYGKDKSDTLYICEGFIDAITLVQWLLDKKQDNFTVYSCSSGVSSLFNCLSEINFSNFKNIKLILDNDEAGDKATENIILNYHFIKDCRQFLINKNIKDVNNYYVKYIRNEV
ncbi:MAG: toprim domain-containing protein [Romboutsia timonensis]